MRTFFPPVILPVSSTFHQQIPSDFTQTNLLDKNIITMEKAKQAVSNFLSQDGKHKTTVDEEVRKPVVDEHVLPKQHEEVITAVDKEVHQDHHQTIVQPVKNREVLSVDSFPLPFSPHSIQPVLIIPLPQAREAHLQCRPRGSQDH